MEISEVTLQHLKKEIPALTAQIRALYQRLDQITGLSGASIPIRFSFDRDVLGAYTRKGNGEYEHFLFSLLFVGHGMPKPLTKEEREDLYKHEYAHYMQYNMEIPKRYNYEAGKHGSAWRYCCSIVGAAPTPYYKAGEALMKHDYKKALYRPIHDKTLPVRDQYRQEKAYKAQKESVVQFKVGETVHHPKYGDGTIEVIEQVPGNVRLKIRFGEELKVIGQSWLVNSQYKSMKERSET